MKEYTEKEYDLIDQTVLLWNIIHYMVLRYRERHPDWIFVRHEDISYDPLNKFASIFKRLNLEWSADVEKKVKEYLDIPYQRGGVSRQGMDCSGFSKTIYSQLFGIDLPHTSVGQFRMGDLKKIEARQMKPGDLIFFANKKKKKINHVGVYLSDHKFIHASSSQGIMVSSLDESYWKKRFVGSKRHVALGVPKESTIVKIRSERRKRYK